MATAYSLITPEFTLVDNGCPICGSFAKLNIGRPHKKNATFQRFDGQLDEVHIVRCLDCSGMYVSPMVYFSDELLTELYGLHYFKPENVIEDLKGIPERYEIMQIANRLMPLKGKSFLDIGCGTGEYLKIADEFGMGVTGIDINQTLATFVRNKYGYNVSVGLFGSNSFPRHSFDVIMLSHVVEHVQEPVKLLRSIRRLLKPDGLFVMAMPNVDALVYDLHGLYRKLKYPSKSGALSPFQSPYHILGFNLKSSRRLLERTGFSPLHCKAHSGIKWEDSTFAPIMKTIKAAGAMLGKGISIVTMSRAI